MNFYFQIRYNEREKILNVTVVEAQNMPNGNFNTLVQVFLQPGEFSRKQTKEVSGTHPLFNESFAFSVSL